LQFLQWRPEEKMQIVLYLERSDPGVSRPELFARERYLLDGDILFSDSLPKPDKRPLLNSLPVSAATSLRVFSLVVIALLLLLVVVFMLWSGIELIKYSWWRQFNYPDFLTYLTKKSSENVKYACDPVKIPVAVIEAYPGVKPPLDVMLIEGDNKVKGYLKIYIVAFLITCSFIIALATLYYV